MSGKMTYVGLDVHRQSIMAVWGKVKEPKQTLEVPNTEAGILTLLAKIGRQYVWAVYEASGEGYGLLERLMKEGWQVDVLAPTKIRRSASQKKDKTDARDAEALYELLMSHGELGTKLPRVWVPDRALREDREVVRRRLKLGDRLSRVKVTIRSFLRMHGIEAPRDRFKVMWTQKHVRWLTDLTLETSPLGPKLKSVLASHLREFRFVRSEVQAMEGEVTDLAAEPRYEKPMAKIRTYQGVGVQTAMTYLTEMGTPHRFQNRRQVGAYFGIVPASYESGAASDRKGHITRMGPAGVRKVLNQSAWAFLRLNPTWRTWYEQVAHRRGKKRAIVAVMRRLAILLWQQAKAA